MRVHRNILTIVMLCYLCFIFNPLCFGWKYVSALSLWITNLRRPICTQSSSSVAVSALGKHTHTQQWQHQRQHSCHSVTHYIDRRVKCTRHTTQYFKKQQRVAVVRIKLMRFNLSECATLWANALFGSLAAWQLTSTESNDNNTKWLWTVTIDISTTEK